MDIGFIGLGNMGAPMAANLVAAGHRVTGYDLSEATVDVASARAVAAQTSAAGMLSGGAQDGTLTFMAGESAQAFALAEPLFAVMGQKVVHCGDSGAGQAAKICNNMILGATMIVTCEAFALADDLGLDRQKMFDVVGTSSGHSWTMNAHCPAPGVGPASPSDNDYTPGFAAGLMLKDLRLVQRRHLSTPSLSSRRMDQDVISPPCCKGLKNAVAPPRMRRVNDAPLSRGSS